jgi:hypothetical protein
VAPAARSRRDGSERQWGWPRYEPMAWAAQPSGQPSLRTTRAPVLVLARRHQAEVDLRRSSTSALPDRRPHDRQRGDGEGGRHATRFENHFQVSNHYHQLPGSVLSPSTAARHVAVLIPKMVRSAAPSASLMTNISGARDSRSLSASTSRQTAERGVAMSKMRGWEVLLMRQAAPVPASANPRR